MAGNIKKMIDSIISQKSSGSLVIASSVRTKLILKGIRVNEYTNASPDDEKVIEKLKLIAKDFGVKL